MVKRISRRVALLEVFLLVVMLAGAYYYISPSPPAPGTYLAVIDAPGAGEVRRDVTYCTAGNVAMHMDLFFPQVSGTAPSPVALYIHGGGWTSGSKDWLGRVVDPNLLTAKGFLVAAVDYRLAPQYKWPAQIQDAKCAVRYHRLANEDLI